MIVNTDSSTDILSGVSIRPSERIFDREALLPKDTRANSNKPLSSPFGGLSYQDVIDRCPGANNWLGLQATMMGIGPKPELKHAFEVAICQEASRSPSVHRAISACMEGARFSFRKVRFLNPALGRDMIVPSFEIADTSKYENLFRAMGGKQGAAAFTLFVDLHMVLRQLDADVPVVLPKVGLVVMPPLTALGFNYLPLIYRHEQTHAVDLLLPHRGEGDVQVLNETIAFLGEYLNLAKRADFTLVNRGKRYWQGILEQHVIRPDRLSAGMAEVLRPFMPSGVNGFDSTAEAITQWVKFLRASNDDNELLPALMSCESTKELAKLMHRRYSRLYSDSQGSLPLNELSEKPRGLVNLAAHYIEGWGRFYELSSRGFSCPWYRVDDAYSSIAPFIPGYRDLGLSGLQVMTQVTGWKFDTQNCHGFFCDVRKSGDLFKATVQW